MTFTANVRNGEAPDASREVSQSLSPLQSRYAVMLCSRAYVLIYASATLSRCAARVPLTRLHRFAFVLASLPWELASTWLPILAFAWLGIAVCDDF